MECEKCGNEFKSKTKLKTPKKNHENGCYDCDVCGNQFNKINEMNTHKRDMHDIVKLSSIRESLDYEQITMLSMKNGANLMFLVLSTI